MDGEFSVADLREARRDLEAGLLAEVTHAVDGFRARTGFTPSCISIDLVDVAALGADRPMKLVLAVRVTVEV